MFAFALSASKVALPLSALVSGATWLVGSKPKTPLRMFNITVGSTVLSVAAQAGLSLLSNRLNSNVVNASISLVSALFIAYITGARSVPTPPNTSGSPFNGQPAFVPPARNTAAAAAAAEPTSHQGSSPAAAAAGATAHRGYQPVGLGLKFDPAAPGAYEPDPPLPLRKPRVIPKNAMTELNRLRLVVVDSKEKAESLLKENPTADAVCIWLYKGTHSSCHRFQVMCRNTQRLQGDTNEFVLHNFNYLDEENLITAYGSSIKQKFRFLRNSFSNILTVR